MSSSYRYALRGQSLSDEAVGTRQQCYPGLWYIIYNAHIQDHLQSKCILTFKIIIIIILEKRVTDWVGGTHRRVLRGSKHRVSIRCHAKRVKMRADGCESQWGFLFSQSAKHSELLIELLTRLLYVHSTEWGELTAAMLLWFLINLVFFYCPDRNRRKMLGYSYLWSREWIAFLSFF